MGRLIHGKINLRKLLPRLVPKGKKKYKYERIQRFRGGMEEIIWFITIPERERRKKRQISDIWRKISESLPEFDKN